jgi:hypothetical protein
LQTLFIEAEVELLRARLMYLARLANNICYMSDFTNSFLNLGVQTNDSKSNKPVRPTSLAL